MALNLSLSGLKKIFPGNGTLNEVQVIEQLDCSIEKGQFVSIVGPSGCGKNDPAQDHSWSGSRDRGEYPLGTGRLFPTTITVWGWFFRSWPCFPGGRPSRILRWVLRSVVYPGCRDAGRP